MAQKNGLFDEAVDDSGVDELFSLHLDRVVINYQSGNRVTYDITSKPPGTIEWE